MTTLGGFEQLILSPITQTFPPEMIALLLFSFLFLVAMFSKLDFGTMVIFGIAIVIFLGSSVLNLSAYTGGLVAIVVIIAFLLLSSMIKNVVQT